MAPSTTAQSIGPLQVSPPNARNMKIDLEPAKIVKTGLVTKETLGYVLAKMPHKDEWKKYYVRYSNS